ncbi:FAD binding domain protein [Aspergillus steynii IBT 23096]|uniref:FAD binding domain protein n=1 Tax=Aspergillus steynii IBT 23096 TaxID=1392250 RepID=A0A2I2GF61_9EURO|nr:FAD binding domain protein [Aspergillus steynii IBT 23096]PLB51512.1 FAD binding domain protein [Aspergillus steynii IBT 23096]
MSRFSLTGRTALVTGGARGCGLAFARGLAEAGADVAVFDIIEPAEGFLSMEKDYGVRTAFYKVDVSSQESLENAFKTFQSDFSNALDICVPCAGINRHLTFLEFTYKDHQDLLSVNVMGLFFTAQLAAKQMIANGTKHGSIVLVASMASHVAVRDQMCSAYCGSKGAVRAMCPAIAKEMAPYGIRVNSISPGYVRTEMTASFPHLVEKWKADAMNGRIAEPDDIMGACVFLASDASAYMTGADVVVDGGVTKCSENGFHEESTTVVVVGAGPSGLMLACNLVRYGINTVLLDDRPDKTSTGKADGMQPKTIETFRQLRLADPLLKNAARVYDIAFWESTPDSSLHRTGRKTHYPDHLVGAADPYILLAHQGMIEDILIQDMEDRGVGVRRSSPFVRCDRLPSGRLRVEYENAANGSRKTILSDYLVGCDGARSQVREFIPDAQLEGDMTNASWGVLDGVIETDFPDLWSKVAVRSHTAGSILWIPRERNMTRLYVQLSSTDGERVDRKLATAEYVMKRAEEAMHPFSLKWKTIEWFGNYVVGQRVARKFSDADGKIFIAGDAGHVHSALAAQGANTSMHDSFNLAWKLNFVVRGLASPFLLSTYEEERRKIANDLINFDAGHCEAFAQGDEALAQNFDDNIRFISGIGAEYNSGMLTAQGIGKGRLKPGALMIPAKVTRYIDANPVDIQIDIPMLGQFRVYLFLPDVKLGMRFLDNVCQMGTALGGAAANAQQSYATKPRGYAPSDEFLQPQRYTPVSDFVTYALVTRSEKTQFEIADLPESLQKSRWTLYLDNGDTVGCTDKWMGQLGVGKAGVVIVRPDGYAGAIGSWDVEAGDQAKDWIDKYFQAFS